VNEAESIRFIIPETLKPLGYEIDTAENGGVAFQKIESKKLRFNHHGLYGSKN